jgi:hypothetical protein
MEGWRQRRLGSKEDHSTTKGNYKTDLTLTGLLMEGLGPSSDECARKLGKGCGRVRSDIIVENHGDFLVSRPVPHGKAAFSASKATIVKL